jgi:ribosomal protein S3AE
MAIAKKKKKFFSVEIPIIGKETQLQAYELEELKGRHIKYDLTRSLRGKSIILQAIIEMEDKIAKAKPIKISLMPYFLKRMVRKGTNYVEDSFSTEAKDSILRIKPFLVTRRKVSRAVRKALRNKAKEELIEYVKDKNSEEIFDEILKNNVQKKLSLILKKIYPLSTCEIKVLKVEKFKEKSEEKTTKEVNSQTPKEEKENKKSAQEKKEAEKETPKE